MRPRRKQDDWAQAVQVAPVKPLDADIADRAEVRDSHASPALMLQEQLVARLASGAPVTAEVSHPIQTSEVKLPVAMRIATIVTLSVALWGGIFLAVFGIISR